MLPGLAYGDEHQKYMHIFTDNQNLFNVNSL
jgi:hypothetical protein